MNLDTFKVLNSVRKLGFTEADFAAMEAEIKLYMVGIGIVARQGDLIAYYDHDEKERGVCIEKAEGKLALIEPPVRILCKTLITFMDIPEEVLTLHKVLRYTKHGEGDSEPRWTATTLEQLRARLFKRFEDKVEHGHYMATGDLQAFFWLLGKEMPAKFEHEPRLDFATVVYMEERNNTRIAVFCESVEETEGRGMFTKYYSPTGKEKLRGYLVRIFTPDDVEFNLICPGREAWFSGRSTIYLDDDMQGKLVGREMLVVENALRESSWAHYDSTSGAFVLDEAKYRRVQGVARTLLLTAQRETVKHDVQKNYDAQSEKLFNTTGFVRWNIRFQKNRISLNDLAIEGPDLKKFVLEGGYLPRTYYGQHEQTSFDSVAEDYINRLLQRSNRNMDSPNVMSLFRGTAKIKIGKAKMVLSRVENKFYVNGLKVRESELVSILMSGLRCSQTEFDAWLPTVSKMGYRMVEAVRDGVSVEITLGGIHGCEMKMPHDELKLHFKVKWASGRAWLVHDGKDYSISRSDAFFKLNECREHYRRKGSAIDEFCKRMHTAVPSFPHSEIGKLIEECDRRYLARTKKSEEFLADAVRLTKATHDKNAYYVIGESGTKYEVQPSLQVYRFVGEQRENVCLRDMGGSLSDEAAVNDRIAARLLALHKDAQLAGEIYARGDHVQDFWKEIAR